MIDCEPEPGVPAPRHFTTYRRADGEVIAGEYSFVTELEWFEDSDTDPTELIEEVWALVSTRTFVVNPYPPDEDDE